MPAHRYPILLWEDFGGGFTAALVPGGVECAAVADSPREAVAQVEQYLEWLYARQSWLRAPDFQDAEIVTIRVDVRPEYSDESFRRDGDDDDDDDAGAIAGAWRPGALRRRSGSRTFASQEPIALLVTCVRGRGSSGLLMCAMPMLDLRFTYAEEESFKELVTHGVQSALKGHTPQQLARFLPPKSTYLDEIVIQAPRETRRAGRDEEEALKHLSAIAEPLDARAVRRQLSRPWERDEQVDRLVDALTRDRSGVILVGDAGSGKTAVLVESVRKVRRALAATLPGSGGGDETDDTSSKHPRFWLTSGARLISGMRYLGQWQNRCEGVVAELARIGGTLCVENILELVRVGGVGPGDGVAAFLMPYLQRGELRLVGEATAAELDACRRLLPGFAELFQLHVLPPFTRRQAVAALGHIAAQQKQQLRVDAEPGAVELLCRLFARFMPYHAFPGRASAFLAQLFDRAYREHVSSVTAPYVISQFVRQTGLPEFLLRDEMPLERTAVVAELRRQVIGQDAACDVAADVIVTFKAGLNDPGRPIATMLFCGPTGVGKTELAKAMSRYLFGHGEQQDRLVRLDMSEYAGPGAAARLLGNGRGEPSPFVQRVRQQPFAVVLLDEIEKAAPDVFDLLLGVLDEGRLTDPYGRLTSFRSAIVIMTSNLGAARPGAFGLAPRASTDSPAYDDEAMRFFRPEFYNRIDAVVTFDPLGETVMRRIVQKELSAIAMREGMRRNGLRLNWSDALVEHLLKLGFDARYGARPLQRTLEACVVVPLSRFLMEHPSLRNAEILLELNKEESQVIVRRDRH